MLNDLKFAWRSLRHSPGFAFVAVLTVAIAIGANTAILSFADAVLFRPLPYREPDQLALLMLGDRQTGRRSTLVPGDYLAALTTQHISMSAPAMFGSGPSVRIDTPDGVEDIGTIQTTPNYFDILGVQPIRGRAFTADDLGDAGRAALLTYASWQKRFGGDSSIVGRSITLGSKTFDIRGVLPAGFVVPAPGSGTRRAEIVIVVPPDPPSPRGGYFYPVVRLAPGVSRERAQAELDALGATIGASNPQRANRRPVLVDVRETMFAFGKPMIRLLVVAAGLVLLLGAANLANMMLARGRGRERASSVRASLGASRLALMRPVIIEALMIGGVGSAIGIVVNTMLFEVLARAVPAGATAAMPVGVDARVVVIAGIMGLAASLVFACVPAWRASRADVQHLLQSRSAGSTSRLGMIGRPMVALQVTLALALIVGATATAQAFVAILRTPLGFDATNVATINFTLPRDVQDLRSLFQSLVASLAARGDVEAAASTGSLPMSGAAPWETAKRGDGGTGEIGVIHVWPGFFETLKIPLIRGRALTANDVGSDAMVVSQAAAILLFGAEDPLGRSVTSGSGSTWQIIGIAADVKHAINSLNPPAGYVVPRGRTSGQSVVVRVKNRQLNTLSELKRTVQPLLPGQIIEVAWWDDEIMATTPYKNPRFQTIVLTSFAAIALGLTALGLFGLVSFLVASRTRELGIRLAIGASPRSLMFLTMRQMLWPVVVGLGAGLLATRWLARLAEVQLFKVDTRDPATLALATIVVLISAMTAAYLPARRAERVDPIVALRTE